MALSYDGGTCARILGTELMAWKDGATLLALYKEERLCSVVFGSNERELFLLNDDSVRRVTF